MCKNWTDIKIQPPKSKKEEKVLDATIEDLEKMI